MVRCVDCHKDVKPEWAFCPFCGGDNRPPESRPPVSEHAHDFSQGYHCILCGESYAKEAQNAPAHGMVYRSWSLNWTMGVFAVLLFLVTLPGTYPMSSKVLLALRILCGLLVVCAALYRSKVMVDSDRREVREVNGPWPLVLVHVSRFEDCSSVLAGVRISSSRYGYNTYFPISVMLNTGDTIQVDEFSDSTESFAVGSQIAALIGIPFHNEVGGVY